MFGPGFIDDLDIDVCGGFFDHIDDLLDFPIEDVEGFGGVGGECDDFQGAWPPPLPPTDAFVGSSVNAPSGKNHDSTTNTNTNTAELPTELSVPHEDIAQLEWLSNFVEDSFSAGTITIENNSCDKKKEEDEEDKKGSSQRFQTLSPVSVLESSSSSSSGERSRSGSSSSSGFRTMPLSPETFVPGRARSKRPRPATFNPRPHISLVSPTSSITDANPISNSESPAASEFENYAESHFMIPFSATEQQQKKKKKKKLPLPPQPLSTTDQEQQPTQLAVTVRKCLHCEITKTPQWRAGPLGPKTLCNACGVRFKSGRLFPEYRPAASPTFVASLHSNSHKKVLEMRGNDVLINYSPYEITSPDAITITPELVPNNNPLLNYI